MHALVWKSVEKVNTLSPGRERAVANDITVFNDDYITIDGNLEVKLIFKKIRRLKDTSKIFWPTKDKYFG